MKLGVTYNVFDGIELLEPSIKSIRNAVDYVNVVYQTTSNYGEYFNNQELLNDLVARKLVDGLILYNPNIRIQPKQNETYKRNIGLADLRENNCTYFMNLDVDEFYKIDELIYAKDEIIKNGYEGTIVRNIRYYKYPTVEILNFLGGYVDYAPLIYSTKYNLGTFNSRYLLDPSRRINTRNIHAFPINEVVMHHMAYIREDIRKKFNNKSSNTNFGGGLENTIKHFENYKIGDDVILMFQNKECIMKVKIVEDYFDINTYFKYNEK